MRRGLTDYNFLIPVNKPCGISSHDVVNYVRKIFGEGRVGHMGTLDPAASGVMLLGIGQAARLNQYLHDLDKTYIAEAFFGQATNTYDSEGAVTKSKDVPDKILDYNFAKKTVKAMVGKQRQIPPAYSAIKINGKVSYAEARKGNIVEIPARDIEVYDAQVLEVNKNIWKIMFRVSGGTYIRTLINDLGIQVDCPAHVSYLKRVTVHNVSSDIELDELSLNNFEIVNPLDLISFPQILADDNTMKAVKNGNYIKNIKVEQCKKYCIVYNNKLVAIYKAFSSDMLKASSVFLPGIDLS